MARTQIDKSLIPSIGSLSKYRRPNLLYVDAFRVQPESGLIDGNSSNTHILFTDGELRVDSTASHVLFDITRNAVFNGSNQSGLRTGLSEAVNTWYAIYAVKEQNGTGWVMVGDTVLPIKTNYSTINTNFGTNGWVYLGLIRNGDNKGATGDILSFAQSGNFTLFTNSTSASGSTGYNHRGTFLATGTSVITLTYTYSAGTGTTQIPNNIGHAMYGCSWGNITGKVIRDAANSHVIWQGGVTGTALTTYMEVITPASEGIRLENGPGSAINYDIIFCGFTDTALGIGTNPLV